MTQPEQRGLIAIALWTAVMCALILMSDNVAAAESTLGFIYIAGALFIGFAILVTP